MSFLGGLDASSVPLTPVPLPSSAFHTPAKTPRGGSSAKKKGRIPLDPTAEAAQLKKEYDESRLARLLAVRQATAAAAAETRAAFARAQQAKAQQAAKAAAEREAREATERQARLEQEYAEATQRLGSAQRDAALQSTQKLAAESALTARRRSLEAHALQRGKKALTLVQAKDQARRAERERAVEVKKRIHVQQEVNRANLEKQQALWEERTPQHMVEYYRIKSQTRKSGGSIPGGPSPQTPAMPSAAHTPASPRWHELLQQEQEEEEQEEEEMSAPRAVPMPHPHPSALPRKITMAAQQPRPSTTTTTTSRTRTPPGAMSFASPMPNTVDVTMHGNSGDHLEAGSQVDGDGDAHGKENHPPPGGAFRSSVVVDQLPSDEIARRSVFHEVNLRQHALAQRQQQQMRMGQTVMEVKAQQQHELHGDKSQPQPQVRRERQQKAFEIVMKREGRILSETVDGQIDLPLAAAAAKATSRPKSAAAPSSKKQQQQQQRPPSDGRRPRTAISHPTNYFRSRARSVIPILTPNAAFFAAAAGAAEASSSSSVMELSFNPEAQTGGRRAQAVAWVIANDDATEQPIQSQPQQAQPHHDPPPPASSFEVTVTGGAAVLQSSTSAPILRGLQILHAHQAQRASSASASAAARAVTAARDEEKIEAAIGGRFFAQATVPSEEIIQRAAAEEEEEEEQQQRTRAQMPAAPSDAAGAPRVSTPPVTEEEQVAAVDVAAGVLSDAVFISQANSAQRMASARKRAQAPAAATATPPTTTTTSSATGLVAATPNSTSTPRGTPPVAMTPRADRDLEDRLNQILRKHLHGGSSTSSGRQEDSRRPEAAQQKLLFSPQEARAVDSSDDDGDEAEDAASVRRTPAPSSGLTSFTSPAFASPSFTSPSSFPASSPPDARRLLSGPTAATDLFIETIHFYLDQEQQAAREMDAEVEKLVAHTATTIGRSPLQPQQLMALQQQRDGVGAVAGSVAVTPVRKSHGLPPPSAFASPIMMHAATSTVAVATPMYAHPSPYMVQTPAKFGGPAIPPSTDRKGLAQAFRTMTDAEFAQAQPIHVVHVAVPMAMETMQLQTPSGSAMHTPMRSANQTPHQAHHHAGMQQRFEQRMAF